MYQVFSESSQWQYRRTFDETSALIPQHLARRYRTSRISLTEISNATLFSSYRSIVIRDADGRQQDSVSLLPNEVASAEIDGTPVREVEGTLVFMRHYAPECFYHWLIDTLPAFSVLERAGIALGSDTSLYLHSFVSSFQREKLQQFGLDPSRVFSYYTGSLPNPNEACVHLKAERLLVPQIRLDDGPWPNPDALAWLSQLILDGWVVTEPDGRGTLLYLARGAGTGRCILNESSLIEALLPLGFQIICMDDYSLTDQAKLLAGAQVVVSGHGSALANLVFSRPGTKVLEFCGHYLSNHYRLLSDLMRLDYDVVAAGLSDQKAPLPVGSDAAKRTLDYEVDIDLIVKQVATKLSVVSAA